MALRQVGFDPGCRCWVCEEHSRQCPCSGCSVFKSLRMIYTCLTSTYQSGMIEWLQVNFESRDVCIYIYIYAIIHGSLNVPIEHHPTIRYMVYNGYYKVMSNIPKMGQLPTPVIGRYNACIVQNMHIFLVLNEGPIHRSSELFLSVKHLSCVSTFVWQGFFCSKKGHESRECPIAKLSLATLPFWEAEMVFSAASIPKFNVKMFIHCHWSTTLFVAFAWLPSCNHRTLVCHKVS